MDQNTKTIHLLQVEQCKRALASHGFEVDVVADRDELLSYLKEHIEKGSTIGVGGSMTLFETGVIEWLTGNDDYQFLDRYHTDDVNQVFHDSLNADYYLMSSNAVTLDGQLYNIDGNGNRLAALVYGPKKVYVICGYNKIVRDLDEAKVRMETIAAPANNVRLHIDNPCTKYGSCKHCSHETTICNQELITRRSMNPGRIHIIFVNEELGY